MDLTREEFINLTPDEFNFVFNRRINYIYNNLSRARREGNETAIESLTEMLEYLQGIQKERLFRKIKSSLQGRDPVLYDPVQNRQYNEDQHFQYLRQKYINEGSTVPFEREDYNEMIQKMEREKETAEAELKRQKAEKQQEKLNRPPTGRGLKGGKLATPVLKGLLDASYDSKVKNVGDFEIDKQLSSSTSKVYRNPKTGQVVVAHRGTAGITDWGNNAVYAIGGKEAYKLTSRYKQAEKVQRRAEKKYGAENVSTIGHSQGGLQSELLGGRSKEIITLNKATLPFESNKNKNQYDIRSERDIVSGLNPFAKKSKRDVTIKAKTYNPLTEHSGDVLDRLGKNRVIGKGPKRASSEDDMEFYGSFGKDDKISFPKMPIEEQKIRGDIHLYYDGTPAGYFKVRELKTDLFDMLVRRGDLGYTDYDDFMNNFYPEPESPSTTPNKKQIGPNKKETPQSGKSDSSRMSYDSEKSGIQFNMEDEFDEEVNGKGIGKINRLGRNRVVGKGVYMKGYGRMRGGVVSVSPQSAVQYPTEDEIQVAFSRVRNLVRDRLVAGGLTDDEMNILLARYNYISGDLSNQIEELAEVVQLRGLVLDYLEELANGTDEEVQEEIKKIPTINNWSDVIGAELIRPGMPVVNLMNEFLNEN